MKRIAPAAFVLLLAASPLSAQIPDARLVPTGAFRWSFTPSWTSWDRIIDESGKERLLRSFVSLNSDSAGADVLPGLSAADSAIRSITAISPYRINLGVMHATLDADVRHFPFEFALGLASRLTITASVPFVVTRMNSDLTLDSTSGNAGWNQNLAQSGSVSGPGTITTLLAQLAASATQLSQNIGAGSYGCPGNASCATAQALLARVQALRNNIGRLAGVGATTVPAAAPTASSAAGQAITQEITSVNNALASLSPSVIGASVTMPLPTKRFSKSDLPSVLSAAGLGTVGDEFHYSKLTGLGDAELGARFGLVQGPHVRLTLVGGARLPTGTRDDPVKLIDISPADHQLDLTGGFEAALDPGSVLSLSLAGSYTRQFPDQLDRRITPIDQVITAAPVVRVNRDLGDYFYLQAFPGLRLNDAFRVYAGVTYFNKGTDHYSGAAGASVMDAHTAMRTTSFMSGIMYRSVGGAKNLPIDAGMTYSAVYSGAGGFVPKATTLTMYLRFYYWLWGRTGNGERGTGNGTTP